MNTTRRPHIPAAANHARYHGDFPALNGEVVTQGHTDYCEANGHYSQDGRCARCGELRGPVDFSVPTTTGGTVEFSLINSTARATFRNLNRRMYHHEIAARLVWDPTMEEWRVATPDLSRIDGMDAREWVAAMTDED